MNSLEIELRETQLNFQEFRQASKLLEEELENEVDRLELENKTLVSNYQRVRHELEVVKVKFIY
ncbi:hypothetical protein HMI54_008152 [Coelomomyces lativittatus]|nr:hypothetical protein HMI54_008152 [Coelomomyces lativittatus]